MNESLKATGALAIHLLDLSGTIKESRHINNLVVTTGLEFCVARLASAAADVMSHMAIGSGTASAAAGDTALGSELSRVALTATVTGNSIKYVGTWNAGVGTGSVSEAGVFNAASGGTMLCRSVFSALDKTADDSLQIEWTVTLTV